MSRCRLTGGFTLLELLVAVALFSLVAAMAYTGMAALMGQDRQLSLRTEALQQLQLAMQLIQADVTQMTARPVRDGFGQRQPALRVGQGSLLEFTRDGYVLLPETGLSSLARIRYRLQEGELRRERLLRLDTTDASQVFSRVLLKDVEDLRFLLHDNAGARHSLWPPVGVEDPDRVLPVALEVELQHRDWGQIRRLIPVQG